MEMAKDPKVLVAGGFIVAALCGEAYLNNNLSSTIHELNALRNIVKALTNKVLMTNDITSDSIEHIGDMLRSTENTLVQIQMDHKNTNMVMVELIKAIVELQKLTAEGGKEIQNSHIANMISNPQQPNQSSYQDSYVTPFRQGQPQPQRRPNTSLSTNVRQVQQQQSNLQRRQNLAALRAQSPDVMRPQSLLDRETQVIDDDYELSRAIRTMTEANRT